MGALKFRSAICFVNFFVKVQNFEAVFFPIYFLAGFNFEQITANATLFFAF